MIPKRALSAAAITVVALALLLSFKTPESPPLAASNSADSAIVGEPAATTTPAPTSATTADAGTTDGGTTTPTPATPAPTETATDTAGGYADGTVTGDVESTRFGDVQVQVTISGGKVTEVTALSLPSRDGRSQRISQAAEPILRQEALTAQTASIDLLSGATYTSEAYAESLQSALDQAAA